VATSLPFFPSSIATLETSGAQLVLATREKADAFRRCIKEREMNKRKDQHDKAVEDSFPASDPPAATGITGPRVSTPKADELNNQDDTQKKE
jgi:hypothetical protein